MTNPDIKDPEIQQGSEDKKIEDEINRKLSSIITWDTTDVQVQAHNGSVLLMGTVADTKSLEQTVLVVFTVKGVRQIDNKLKIRKDGIASMVSSVSSAIESITDEERKNKQQ